MSPLTEKKESFTALNIRFGKLKRKYLRLKKGLLTQIWFYEREVGPMPGDEAFSAVQDARDELEDCYAEILQRQAPKRLQAMRRKREVKAARAKVK